MSKFDKGDHVKVPPSATHLWSYRTGVVLSRAGHMYLVQLSDRQINFHAHEIERVEETPAIKQGEHIGRLVEVTKPGRFHGRRGTIRKLDPKEGADGKPEVMVALEPVAREDVSTFWFAVDEVRPVDAVADLDWDSQAPDEQATAWPQVGDAVRFEVAPCAFESETIEGKLVALVEGKNPYGVEDHKGSRWWVSKVMRPAYKATLSNGSQSMDIVADEGRVIFSIDGKPYKATVEQAIDFVESLRAHLVVSGDGDN